MSWWLGFLVENYVGINIFFNGEQFCKITRSRQWQTGLVAAAEMDAFPTISSNHTSQTSFILPGAGSDQVWW